MAEKQFTPLPPYVKNITGKRYGRLVAVSFSHISSQGANWLCRCDCGNTKVIWRGNLQRGRTRSCGCLNTEKRTTHGQSRAPEYRAWAHMKDRCHNPRNQVYAFYGARGITVCQRWRDSFEHFLSDMGSRPSAKHSIDRIKNNGNYEPGNCRWATSREQTDNKRPPRKRK